MKYIYYKNYGCKMNLYDSNNINELLSSSFLCLKTEKILESNIIIINTCSIRNKVIEKIFSDLGKIILNIKSKKNKPLICFTGCIANLYNEINLLKNNININIICSIKNIYKLPKLIKDFYLNKCIQINIKKEVKNNKIEKKFFKKFVIKKNNIINNDISYNISIISGCNKKCSFCIVPFTRGIEISRNYKYILKEIKLLPFNIKEIILLGQNVNAFINLYKNRFINLSILINYISNISNIKWINFITSHAENFNFDLIKSFSKNKKIKNSIHLPIQTGSDKILKFMNRNYSINKYISIIKNIKYIRKNICISTDLIIDFPNETSKDFIKTIFLIKKIKFDISFIFFFDPRPKTLAYFFKKNEINNDRYKKFKLIQKIIKNNSNNIKNNMLNTIQIVIIKKIFKNYLLTYSYNNKKIIVNINEKKIFFIGEIIKIKIINILNNIIIGKII